jgi:hypothetical protein
MTTLLQELTTTTPLTHEANERLHILVSRNNKLSTILKPKKPIT